MFRPRFFLSAILLILLASACSPAAPVEQAPANTAPSLPAESANLETLFVYIDGQAINETGLAYADLQDVMTDHQVNDNYYYGATLAEILATDISAVQGAFLEALDGYITYTEDLSNLYLAAYAAKDGLYMPYETDGKSAYGGIVPGAKDNKGVVHVYLVSTSAAFEVEIQKNGEKIGAITLSDFLQKTEVNGEKVPTVMFDGSFLYNYGENTYEGRFLGISYETMLAKLAGMGMDLSGNIVEVEYYGTNGLENIGKNFEYSTDPTSDKYFGLVDFYCMYDGKTYNSDTASRPVGLTAFINGTGGRWMTMSLTAINFIIE